MKPAEIIKKIQQKMQFSEVQVRWNAFFLDDSAQNS